MTKVIADELIHYINERVDTGVLVVNIFETDGLGEEGFDIL